MLHIAGLTVALSKQQQDHCIYALLKIRPVCHLKQSFLVKGPFEFPTSRDICWA